VFFGHVATPSVSALSKGEAERERLQPQFCKLPPQRSISKKKSKTHEEEVGIICCVILSEGEIKTGCWKQ
jgi:hypothetical protein